LEVNGMHVLHRPHHPNAITVTLIAAMLAIVLTLAITSAVSDVESTQAPASATSPTAALHASPARPSVSTSPFMRSPFSSLLTAPVAPPWSQDSR
jgi:hypothetical protein